MNVERWLKTRRPAWEKLEQLLRRVDQGGVGRLDRHELQELGRLYRSASADLSRARALKLGQEVQVYLNNLVVKAHNQVYQREANRWRDLRRFLWVTFPYLVRTKIHYISLAFAIFIVPAVLSYFLTLNDINFAQLEMAKGHPLVPDEMWHMIENKQMWTDSVQGYSQTAASLIATNNIKVAIMAFVFGITYGIGTTFVLWSNGLMLGTTFGVCKVYGMAERLLAFVAPHGVLELSAIFISGGAGLLLGRALLFPGQYRRLDALRLVARDAAGLFGGCVPLLLVAGMIEGFISPRTDLGPDTKFAISLATLLALFLYLFVPRGEPESSKATTS